MPVDDALGALRGECEYDLFVSYPHAINGAGRVSDVVQLLRAACDEKLGRPLRVFFDLDDIRGMDDWERRILVGLRSSKVMAAFIAPEYFLSEYCGKEHAAFVEHECALGLPTEGIVPLRVDDAPLLDEVRDDDQRSSWVADLRTRQMFDLRPWWPAGDFGGDDMQRVIDKMADSVAARIRRVDEARRSPKVGLPPRNELFAGRAAVLRKCARCSRRAAPAPSPRCTASPGSARAPWPSNTPTPSPTTIPAAGSSSRRKV